VKLFDDRLVVESPGRLPGMVRLHTMREIHFSRNPIIARVMTEMEYMRELGEGVDRMIREMEQMGLDLPVFEEYAFMMRVSLRNNLDRRGLKRPGRTIIAEDLAQLHPRHRVLLAYLQEHESVSRSEYQKLVSVSTPTAKSDLQMLISKGFIKKVGGARATRYQRV